MPRGWKAYNELAWTVEWLAQPEDYDEEAGAYVSLICKHAAAPPRTLLHLGSGAGGMDRTFKRCFAVTGVDLSPGMLALARAAHPEIEYIEADIRTLHLDRRFDAVVIPDCIDYMVTRADLDRALAAATGHLRPGGVLLVAGKTKETFRNNNFAYSGERDGIHVTLLENNHAEPAAPDTYEAALIYLIRAGGRLTTHMERHVLGLFSRAVWEKLFARHRLQLHQTTLDGVYDAYLLAGAHYLLQVFVGVKAAP